MKLVNQHLIKDNNMKSIYHLIDANPGISRARLAKLTDLSKPTVSTLVDELIDRDFISDFGSENTSGQGRKPNCLRVKANTHFAIVLNWLEDMVNIQVIDLTGKVAASRRLSIKMDGGKDYIQISSECIRGDLLKDFDPESILFICIVVSGMLDIKNYEIYSTTMSINEMQYENVFEYTKNAFPEYMVVFLEDTACYAYEEQHFTNLPEENFAFLHFNRGVGATIFVNGRMVGRASGAYTQFGHFSIDPNGPLCCCGNRGCVEKLLAEHCLKERLAEFESEGYLTRLKNVSFQDVAFAERNGEEGAHKLMRRWARQLAQAIANMVCITNPNLIILGGTVRDFGDNFLQYLQEELSYTGFRRMVDSVTVKYSELPTEAFYRGAMRYVLDQYFHFAESNSTELFIG